jgi:hypothetical protein
MLRDHLVVLLAAGSIACGSSSPPPTVHTVVITASALELPIGGTLQLVANAFDESGIVIPGKKAVWTSSDPRIATVSDVGVLTGVAFGGTNVTATVDGLTGAQPFTVAGVQSGAGTAVMDGVMSAGEWDHATRFDIAVNVPGGTTPGKLYVMNDTTNLYLALTFSRTPPAGEHTNLIVVFDDDASGNLSNGDDALELTDGVFQDLVESTAAPCPAGSVCGDSDIGAGGRSDGEGASINDGTTSVYELRHPLRSGDTHDFSLVSGNVIGTNVFFRLLQMDGAFQDTNVPGVNLFFPLTIR